MEGAAEMHTLRVLYISGSLGLGHVTRDLAIARKLRQQLPGVDIRWLAVHPATLMLEHAGETVLPEASSYTNENVLAEQSAQGSKLSLLRYLLKSKGAWQHNMELFAKIVSSQQFDLVIGDETYEISLALRKRPELKRFPFVMIFDFVGLDAMTNNLLERLGVYFWNRVWSHDYRKKREPSYDLGLFIGEPEDVSDTRFGFMLPSRRQFATAMYRFVGYVFPFEPSALANQADLRKELGYGPEPLVIVSIGGTSIGKELLERCGEAYTIVREKVPTLHMVLVAGPRVDTESLRLPKEVEVRQFVPDLYKHFAACDLAIVQGGATSTLELTALNRPFLYFPLEGHSEQASVARILTKRRAGIQMRFADSTPASLAEKILSMLGVPVSYLEIPTDGAKNAAQLIVQLLDRSRLPITGI
jgi:UDP:flavonoid glycosyltransferase YjiC (YdhE family)